MFITFSLNKIKKNGTLPRMWCGMLLIQLHFFDELLQKETLSKHSQECTTKFSRVCSAIKFRLSRVLYAFILAQSRNHEFFYVSRIFFFQNHESSGFVLRAGFTFMKIAESLNFSLFSMNSHMLCCKTTRS